jgi:hypothetical protein
MQVRLFVFLLVLASFSVAQSSSNDLHFRETGSSAIFLRSAFAHGYRHGYEDGYHLGNVDVNMGRHARIKFNDLHGAASRYSPDFGPRKSFDSGYLEGMKAGYGDGFVGRNFRAVENLRFIALALDDKPGSTDPTNRYFDQGIADGYNKALDAAQKGDPSAEQLDLRFITCDQFHPANQHDMAAQESFCDGYRRGYVLGHADGIILRPDSAALAARK